MKYLFILLFFSFSAHANLVNTAWTGKNDLFIDGKFHCSTDSQLNPPVLNTNNGYLTIRQGGLGWIWVELGGGCSTIWGLNSENFGFQIKDNVLFDQRGLVVGKVTSTSIEATKFYSDSLSVFVDSIVIKSTDMEKLSINFTYKFNKSQSNFNFVGSLERHRDSVWP